MAEPTEEERLDFVRSYGVEPVTDINTDLTAKEAATFVAEMTPIVGDAMAAKQIYDEVMKADPDYKLIAALGGAAVVGLIPGVGDAVAAGIRKTADVAKRIEMDPNRVGMMGGNIRIRPKAEEGIPTVEAAGLTDEAIEKWRKENATSDEFRKALKGRNPELQEAAAGVKEGRVFTSTYRKLADDLRPIRKVTEVPKPATITEVVSALDAGKRKSPIVDLNYSIPDGDQITARLDINAYTDYDVWVPTLKHSGKTMYKPSVILEDVKFIQPEAREVGKAMDVAVGPERLEADFGASPKKGNKAPFAVMTGNYVEGTNDDAYNIAKAAFDNPEFTQVGYDPTRRGFFYDRETGEAIVEADMVVQVGHLVLARNAKKMDAEAFSFSEGGMAIEEQMSMNFGDVPDNTIGVDPVSGNEIPLGATAENVRDDIPSNLSEGEIVIPADVVNFHGIKLFEDLRAEAKMGYAQMNADGRIGGSPVPTSDNELGLELADLEIMEVPDEPQQMADGGLSKEKPVFKNRAEAILYFLTNMFDYEDDDEPEKPKDKPKIDFGFGGNLMERAARKYDFDEGGLGVNPPRVVDEGKVGSILPEGFDPAVDRVGSGTGGGSGVMEMREYQNAEGHTIMIPFIDGVPQELIPEGYFPTGAPPVSVTPGSGGGSGSSSQGGGSSNDGDKEATEPFVYEELTIDELREEVENLRNSPKFAGTTLFTGIIALAQARHKDKTIKEIERRLESTDLAIYEREYLQNLLEVAKAPAKKGMLTKVLDKLTGAEPEEEPDLPELDKPKFDDPEKYNQLYLFEPGTVLNADEIAEKLDAYKPETSATPSVKNPFTGSTYDEVVQQRKEDTGFSPEIKTAINQASADAATKAFGSPAQTVKPVDNDDFIASVKKDPTSFLPPTPTPPSNTGGYDPVGGGSVDDPTRRTGGGGRNKGGLMKGKKKKATKNKKSK